MAESPKFAELLQKSSTARGLLAWGLIWLLAGTGMMLIPTIVPPICAAPFILAGGVMGGLAVRGLLISKISRE